MMVMSIMGLNALTAPGAKILERKRKSATTVIDWHIRATDLLSK